MGKSLFASFSSEKEVLQPGNAHALATVVASGRSPSLQPYGEILPKRAGRPAR
jgi:hypothetical protein